MPRSPRLDAPGVLLRQVIFRDDKAKLNDPLKENVHICLELTLSLTSTPLLDTFHPR